MKIYEKTHNYEEIKSDKGDEADTEEKFRNQFNIAVKIVQLELKNKAKSQARKIVMNRYSFEERHPYDKSLKAQMAERIRREEGEEFRKAYNSLITQHFGLDDPSEF